MMVIRLSEPICFGIYRTFIVMLMKITCFPAKNDSVVSVFVW